MSDNGPDDAKTTSEDTAAPTEPVQEDRPASADEPGVAPQGTIDADGPGGTEDGASSDGDSGPTGGEERADGG